MWKKIIFYLDLTFVFKKTVIIVIVVSVKQDQKTRVILYNTHQMSEFYP